MSTMTLPSDGINAVTPPPSVPPDPSMGLGSPIAAMTKERRNQIDPVQQKLGSLTNSGDIAQKDTTTMVTQSTSHKVSFNDKMETEANNKQQQEANSTEENVVAGDESNERRVSFKVKFKFNSGTKQVNVASKHKAFLCRFFTAAPGATFTPSTNETLVDVKSISTPSEFPADGDTHKRFFHKKVINLYEADYALIIGIHFRKLSRYTEEHQLLNPGCYGFRQGRQALDSVLIDVMQYNASATKLKHGGSARWTNSDVNMTKATFGTNISYQY